MPTLTTIQSTHHYRSWSQSDLQFKMASKPNLRLATFNVPMFIEVIVINGKEKLRGLKVFTNIVELFERAGFNISLVPVDEITTGTADENGTYNGLYGAIQAGKADTSIIGVPLRLSESLGQFTPVMMDASNVMMTKRDPVQVFEGTLYDCLTTLGPLNNLIFGAIVALILIFLRLLASKHASWNFFAQLMTENFVPFRSLLLQLTCLVALFVVRALFGSAYSTDVTIAIPPKLINSLEDLANSKFLPIWIEADPVYLDFQQKVTQAHADVFNMGPKYRRKTVSFLQAQGDCSELFVTNSFLYFEPCTPSLIKYVCKYKSSQVCSGRLRMFISEPFSRTAWAYVYSKNTSTLTAGSLKKYANQFVQQSLFGNTLKTATDDVFAPSPQCENEISQRFEAVASQNRVKIQLVPWFEMICALVAALAIFLIEISFAIMTFICSVYRYFRMLKQ